MQTYTLERMKKAYKFCIVLLIFVMRNEIYCYARLANFIYFRLFLHSPRSLAFSMESFSCFYSANRTFP